MTPYYEQDGIVIYHADCMDVLGDYMDGRQHRFDLLLTDPPYGIGFAAQPTKWQRAKGQAPEAWDDAPVDSQSLALARKISRDQIIFGGNYFHLPPARCWLSWYKPDAPPSMGLAFRFQPRTPSALGIRHKNQRR